MAKQLNVSLGFSADTSKAKKEIQDLQSMLTKIQTQPAKLFDDVELKKASQAAQDLQHHLNAAINVDTGKLDLNKFSQSLTSSKQKLSDLYKDLSKIGPEGQAAFLQVARSINSADSSALNLGKKLKDLGTSLANTARWQISSSLLHGFMGAVQTAYHYAEDLNSSLNDIRIVTGASVEEMDKFAKKANEAARSLSTTTTEYTKASLIFYQQGLSDDEVAKRTEVTIKMANAAGQSAKIVSDQLTAVWNNFYDGSKSLEYYADVMTALGAATASSTDEIAGGLEKFAAIGQTIGLSYEYAASALATITANTRQSEEVVGTALKTIFARIQGLNLGETLDDGTTLNKYSEALQKVGISIFDSTGELKKMDTILDEMGSKWETLNKAQQTALAQTVAGTRQYTQLVALMDNWNKGDSDSMQANLSTAYGAEGTLQDQADIYAESWEAARDRVTAAAEQIYASLLDDDFFITILNGFEKFLVGVNSVIDGMGGLKGILLLVGGIFTQHFAKEIPRVLSSIAQNFDVITGKAERNKQLMLEQNAGALEKVEVDGMSDSMSAEVQSITQVSRMTAELNKARKSLSETEIQYYENKIRQVEAYGAEATAIGKENEELKKLIETKEESIAKKAARSQGEEVSKLDEEIKKQEELIAAKKRAAEEATSSWEKTSDDKWKAGNAAAKAAESGDDSNYIIYKQRELELSDQLEQKYVAMKEATDDVTKAEADLAKMKEKRAKAGENAKGSKQAIKTELKNLEKVSMAYQSLASEQGKIDKQANAWKTSAKLIGNNAQETNKLKQSMVDYLDHLDNIGLAGDGVDELKSKILDSETSAEQAAQAFDEWRQKAGSIDTTGMENLEQQIDEIESKLRAMGVSQTDLDDLAEQFQTGAITADEYKQALERLQASSSKMPQHIMSASEGFGVFAGKLMQVTSAITALQNIGNIWKDEDASTGQKIMSTMSAMIPIISLVTTLTNKKSLADLSAAASAILQAVGLGGLIPVKGAETAATVAQTGANVGLMASMWPVLLVTLLIVAAIGTLVAIFAGLKAIVEAVSNAYNADAIAAENAENAAKNLGEAYNECKQEYEDMIAAMDNYKSARDALDELTKGTKEYDAALKEANRAAMELINQYGLVEGQDYEWQGDELVVKDEAMDRVSSAKEAEVDQAYAASQMASANAKALRAQANLTETRREIRDDNGLGDGDLIWQGIGASLLNGILPGVGNAIMANQISKSAEMDAAISKAVEEAKDNENLFDTKEAMAEALNIDLNDTELIDALWANQEEIKGLASEMNAAEAAWKLAAQNSANEILNNSEAVQNSDNAEEVMAAGGNMYSVAYQDAYDKYLADAKDRGLFNTGTDASKAAFEAYAEKAGLTDLKNFEVTNYKGDGTVEYKYIDDQGEEKKVLATAEEIAATLAAAEAAEKLGASAENLIKVFNSLDATGQSYDQAMKDFLSTGDFENATKEEATQLIGQVDSSGDGTVDSSEAASYLGTEFGGTDGTLSDEEAKQYGYESAQAMIDAFTEELNNIDEAWESIELPENLTGLSDMSLKTAQNFENAIKDISAGPLGEQAGKDFVDGINKMVSDLDTEDQQAALEKLSDIDWSSWDALEQADAIMKEYGVDIDTTSKEWVEYANKMRIAAGATPDFSKLKDTLTSITSILQDLDFGSVISEEDYQKLVEYNDEWERFFMLQADGTRVFIGDAQAMQKETRADIVAQREALQARKEAQAGFEKANWGHKDENGSWVKADWGNKSGSDTGTATNLMNASGATEDMLEELGYTDEVIQDMITKATSGQADLVAEGEAALREMYQRIDSFTEEELAEMDAQFDEMMASTATNVTDLQNLLNTDQISEEAYDKQLSVLANNAKSLEELKQIQASGLNGEVGLDTYEYGQALTNLASNFDNCAEEIAEYEAALLSGDSAQIEAARSALELSVEIGEMAEKFDLDAKETENYAKRLSKSLGIDEKAASKLAVANQRLDRGLLSLNENLEDYQKSLKTNSKNSAEWSKTMDALKTDLADMFNLADGTMLSDEFAEATLASDDFKKALDGDVEALGRLQTAAADDIMINIVANQSDNPDNIKARWEQLKADFAAIGDIDAPGVDQSNLLASFNEMIAAGNMTKDQIEAALAGLHVSANVKTTYVSQKTTVPQTITEEAMLPGGTATVAVPGPDGSWVNQTVYLKKKVTRTYDAGTVEVDGVVPQYEIEGTEGEGGITTAFTSAPAPTPSYSSTTSGSGGGGGGGGGSSNDVSTIDKRTTTKKSDTVERYREVEDAIDNVTDALTRAERATDRLWGKDKLAAMREENKILEKQRQLLLDKAEQAEEYAKQDAADLRKVADDIGVSVVIDQETGDITNIEDVENTLHERLSAAEAEYNAKVDAYNKAVEKAKADGTVSDEENDKLEKMKDALDAYEEDVIGDIEDDIAAWEDAEQQFQESIETWEDAGLEAEEILDQIMQNNYDIIMEGLEIPLSLNEEDLRLVELQLSRIEDDVYSMAEAVALTSSQFGEYRDNLRLADEALAELNRAHEAGEITDAAYQEGLGEIRDKYYENIEALMELDNTMMEYYSNTIDMANEELSKYTDQIEHQTSVLEHYSSLIELMGKSSDYKMMGKVLEGQVKTTKDAMIVSKQWYETQRANADSLAAEYAAAQARGASEEELELIKANWDAAEASANEAQDKMLSDAEAWAEALRAVLENKLADLGQTLENALTGGTSFDTINTQMERAQSLQEEYLTTTNQIYETNKLMRTAQQEIDKTTNSVAKKKLQAYIAETEQLQNQSKLSQYELDIQKAKYDLLLAEIALEEAQDAKSTVRLQRDSEGNFGYVYTADQNKLAEAQQQLEDAQNSLYNIGLEGANDYAQKYQQTMQEMYDTFADLQQQKLDGAFETEEEYHRAMEEAKAYYYQKLQDYSGLYSVAVTTDSRVVADAWSSDFADMVYDTDEWMSAVDQYVADVELAFKEWSDAVHDPSTGITAIVGGDVAAVGETVQGVTDKSAELAKTTTEKVIPALDNELDAVQNMTGAYANMRKEIQAVIEEYTNMINRINNSQTNEWNNGNSGDGNTGGGDGDGSGSGDDTGGGDGDGSEGDTGGDGEGSGEGAGGDETKTDSYRYGTVEFRGNGADRIWIDEAGKQYAYNSSQGKALQTAFNKAFGRNGGYKGDYWIGWTDTGGKLKADILREKDGLRTGGYTGEWAGSYGKLALLHQKELVLNAQDTENLLTSMEVLNKIVEMIDLQSMSSQLGGMLNSPSLGLHSSEVLEQNVHIEASFPGVQDRSEIEEAFNNLINKASQFANRK